MFDSIYHMTLLLKKSHFLVWKCKDFAKTRTEEKQNIKRSNNKRSNIESHEKVSWSIRFVRKRRLVLSYMCRKMYAIEEKYKIANIDWVDHH